MAIDWDTALNAMHAWVVAGSGLDDQHVVYGQQDAERPKAPAIVMRISNITELGSSWIDYEDNPHTFDDITFTTNAGTDVLTAVAHARETGDGPVRVNTTGTRPGGLAADTDYWVVRLTTGTLQLATSFDNAMATVPVVVNIIDAGTGTHTLVDTDETLRVGEEMVAVNRSMLRLTLELHCHADPVIGPDMAVAVLQRLRGRRDLPGQQAIFEDANIVLQDVERVRAIMGTRDDFLFEPRAFLDLHVAMAVQEFEMLHIISRVTGMNQIVEPEAPFSIPAQ